MSIELQQQNPTYDNYSLSLDLVVDEDSDTISIAAERQSVTLDATGDKGAFTVAPTRQTISVAPTRQTVTLVLTYAPPIEYELTPLLDHNGDPVLDHNGDPIMVKVRV